MALILKQYKLPDGSVNFPTVFKVPISERLPALYKADFMRATALVVGALTVAFERMSFKKKMTGVIVNNIAEEIINSCDEDNLSMEDLLLFLGNMVRGKYGNIEELSVSRFMNLFDKYRDDRHYAMIEYRENEHLAYKGVGDATRSVKEDPMADRMGKLGASLHELRMQLSEERKEKNVLIQAKKYYGD